MDTKVKKYKKEEVIKKREEMKKKLKKIIIIYFIIVVINIIGVIGILIYNQERELTATHRTISRIDNREDGIIV